MKWLGRLGKSLITDGDIKEGESQDDLIYVPNRNSCIIAACVAWAEVIDSLSKTISASFLYSIIIVSFGDVFLITE